MLLNLDFLSYVWYWNQLNNLFQLAITVVFYCSDILEDVKASAAVPFHDERPLLHRFLRSCSDLEELEIISLGRNCGITNVDLSFIAQCRALRKLTLAHFHVQNGRFLEQVITYSYPSIDRFDLFYLSRGQTSRLMYTHIHTIHENLSIISSNHSQEWLG